MPASRKLQLSTGLQIHLLEWGEGGHVVVLVHGFLDNAWGWAAAVEAGLATSGLRIVAPDMRGHGDSDWIGAGGYYYFFDYVADLHALVEQLGAEKLSLVGHSMGGSIAAYYAGVYSERVHKLALLEGLGPPQTTDNVPERVRLWIAAWQRVRQESPRSYVSVDEAAERMMLHDPLLPRAMARELAAHGTTPALGGRVRFKHDPLHVTPGPYPFSVALAESFWRRVRCPTLIVGGAQSLMRHAPDEEKRRIGWFAQAQTVMLDGAGHMMQRHQPKALAETLRAFLTS